jgi:type II secretory pathway pseudopilin PulG
MGKPMASAKESGFTTIEALTAMALIAVAGAMIAGVSTLAIRSAQKSRESVRTTLTLILTNRAIRESAARIRTPYWANADFAESDGNSCMARWLDGKKDDTLTIEKADDAVIIHSTVEGKESQTRVCQGFKEVSINLIKRDDGVPVGLRVDFSLNGANRSIQSAFASVPLNREKK